MLPKNETWPWQRPAVCLQTWGWEGYWLWTVVKRRKASHLEWKGKMSRQMWEGECGPRHSGRTGGLMDAWEAVCMHVVYSYTAWCSEVCFFCIQVYILHSVFPTEKSHLSTLLTMPKPLTVGHNKLWKILKEMGMPEHLTCLPLEKPVRRSGSNS